MDNFLLVPWFIFWTIVISQFGLMEPFKHKDVQGHEVFQSREEVMHDAATENARTAKLEKEADKIRDAYSNALRDCKSRSFDGGEGKSAGASYDYANYIFSTYNKTCYVTKMSGIVGGDYTYSFEVAYTVDLPDWSLMYRN